MKADVAKEPCHWRVHLRYAHRVTERANGQSSPRRSDDGSDSASALLVMMTPSPGLVGSFTVTEAARGGFAPCSHARRVPAERLGVRPRWRSRSWGRHGGVRRVAVWG